MDKKEIYHKIFLALLGLISLASLIYFTLNPGNTGLITGNTDPQTFSLMLILALFARFLAFKIPSGLYVSLDTAFYVSSLINLKTLPTAWIVFITISIDMLYRKFKIYFVDRESHNLDLKNFLLRLLYSPSHLAFLFFVTGYIFQIDQISIFDHTEPLLLITWLVASLSLFILVIHYFILGVERLLSGESLETILFNMVLPGIWAEVLLIPLSILMVTIFDNEIKFNFALLGFTYVLVNMMFFRFSGARNELETRIDELTLVNRLGSRLSSSLDYKKVSKTLSVEVLSYLKNADAFFTAITSSKKDVIKVEIFSRESEHMESLEVKRHEGLVGWVVRHRAPLLLSDIEGQSSLYLSGEDLGDKSVEVPWMHGSWLGVPLIVFSGETIIGAIGIISEKQNAFSVNYEPHMLSMVATQASIALQNARLYEMATVDGLTGLYVRRYFDKRLKDEYERAKRYDASFVVIILDLDDFHVVNDNYGHQAGDKILKQVARITLKNLRVMDIPARYGGEEFTCILPQASLDVGISVAERIRKEIREKPVRLGNNTHYTTCSFGVACFPECGQVFDPIEVLAKADTALFHSKKSGKNKVTGYSDLLESSPEQ